MKPFFLILCSLCFVQLAYAQDSQAYSDLRSKVDSIIQFEIEYKVDSTTNKMADMSKASRSTNGITCFSTTPQNPMTLLVLDGEIIAPEQLSTLTLNEVEVTKVFKKDDSTAMALYGTRAKNGIILLKSKG
ncbi:hypothetical protein [Sediminitomix flava]|uniref:TonB-dependent SusC/RagA subfamily outer membrane receptor n=1 Tax=Sediminitomix flava TaxID=379075 RepID=A0A315ZI22_SEDFL|nr:hypothetical protein [Sediminitomix flava]PWJ44952.1 hypothetical protein BC781_1011345 [Sediminitomix flava]